MLRVKLMLLVLSAVLVAGGVVSASAFAGPVWVVKGKRLEAGEVSQAVLKLGKLTIKWEDKVTKTKFEAECKKASGKVELKGGDPGTDEVKTLTFEECALLKGGVGCKLTAGGVTAEELPGWPTKLEIIGGKIYDALTGVKLSLILEGCEKVSFNKTWLFKGTIKAEMKNGVGKVKVIFPTAAVEGDTLESEGAEASLSGEGELEEEKGGTLEVGEKSLPHWYICEKPGGNTWLYKDSLCVNDNAGKTGAWELKKLAEGAGGLLAVTSQGVPGKNFVFKSKAHGVKLTLEAKKKKDKGWIENPAGGGNGIDLVTDEFEEVEVTAPVGMGCTVKQPIVVKSKTELKTLKDPKATGEPETTWDEFTPDPAGGPFTVITIENCVGGAAVLNGNFNVEGSTAALVHNATSTIQLYSDTMTNLTFALEPVTLEGESLQLTDGGGGIQAL